MRRMGVAVLVGGLGAVLAIGFVTIGGRARAADLTSRSFRFDVFVGSRKVGTMSLHVTDVAGTVMLKQHLEAPYKRYQGIVDSRIVYALDDWQPVRATAGSKLGDLKTAEGEIAFALDASPRVAKVKVKGYADEDQKPLKEPKTREAEVPVPEGTVVTFPALLYLGPRLLPRTGKLEPVVRAHVPYGFDHSHFVDFKGECILTRTDRDESGHYRISLQEPFAGGNYQTLQSATFDREGHVVEARLGSKFVLKPADGSADNGE